MVENTRQLERALGSGDKFVAENEKQTVYLQRRCLRAARTLKAGDIITRDMIDVLRPVAEGAILPFEVDAVIGTKVLADLPAGKEICWTDLGKA
jgi:sialic acid synthase SpsE